jgi:hypothetical protein
VRANFFGSLTPYVVNLDPVLKKTPYRVKFIDRYETASLEKKNFYHFYKSLRSSLPPPPVLELSAKEEMLQGNA